MVCTHSKKPKLSDFEVFKDGYIFLCTAKTESECLQKRIFGTIRSGRADVKKITQRTAIFLYALGRNPVVHGIFVARSPPFLNYRIGESDSENQHAMRFQVRTTLFHKFDSLPGHLLNFAEIGLVFRKGRLKSSSQLFKQELDGKYLTKQQTRGIIGAFMKHSRAESPPSPPPPISVRAIYKSRSPKKPTIHSGKAVKANGLIKGLKTVAPAKRKGLIMGPHYPAPAPGKPKGLIMGPHDPFKEVLAPVHNKSKKRKKHRKKEQSSHEMAFSLKGRPNTQHVRTKGRRHKINSTNTKEKQGTRKYVPAKGKNKGREQVTGRERKKGKTIRNIPNSSSKKKRNSESIGNSRPGSGNTRPGSGNTRPGSGNTRPAGNSGNTRSKGITRIIGNSRLNRNSIIPTGGSRSNGGSRSSGNSGPGSSRVNMNSGPENSRLNVNLGAVNVRINGNSRSRNIRSNRPRGDYDLCWDFISGRCRRAQCMWRHEMSANPDYKPPRWVKKSWEKRTPLLSNKWRGRNKYLSLDE